MNPRNILFASLGLALLIPVTVVLAYRALFARADSAPPVVSGGETKPLISNSSLAAPTVRTSAAVVNKSQRVLAQIEARDSEVIAKLNNRLPTILAQAKQFQFAATFEEFQRQQQVLRELESHTAQTALQSVARYRAMIDSIESGMESIRTAKVELQDLELGNNISSGVSTLKAIAEKLRATTKLPESQLELDPSFVDWVEQTHQRIRQVADSLDPDLLAAKQVETLDQPDDELSTLSAACEAMFVRVKAKLRRSSRFQFFFGGKAGGLGKARKFNRAYTPDELQAARRVCRSARVSVILWPSKDAQIEEEWTTRKSKDDDGVIEVVAPTAGRREVIGSFDSKQWFENEAACWEGCDTDQKVYAICLTGDYGSAIFVRCEQQNVNGADVVNTSYQFDLPDSVDGEDLSLNAMHIEIDGDRLKQREAGRWFHLPAEMLSGIHAEIAGKIVALTGNTINRNSVMQHVGGKGAALTIEGRSLVMMLKPSIHELKQKQADLDRLFVDDFRQEFGIATNREERRLSGLKRRIMLADRIVLLAIRIAELTRQIAGASGSRRSDLIRERAALIERKRKCEKMMNEWIPPMLVTEHRERFSREATQSHVRVIGGEVGVNLFDNFGVDSGYFAAVIKLVSGQQGD